MKVITKTLRQIRQTLRYIDPDGTRFDLPQSDWRELGKPAEIVVQISVPPPLEKT